MCDNTKTCPNGNCPGCRNGQVWCQDPRCVGSCPDCFYDPDRERTEGLMIMLIVVIMLFVLIIIVVNYGHRFWYYYVPDTELRSAGYSVPQNYPAIHY